MSVEAKGYPTIRDCIRESEEDSFSEEEDRMTLSDFVVHDAFSTPSIVQAKMLYDYQASRRIALSKNTRF